MKPFENLPPVFIEELHNQNWKNGLRIFHSLYLKRITANKDASQYQTQANTEAVFTQFR